MNVPLVHDARLTFFRRRDEQTHRPVKGVDHKSYVSLSLSLYLPVRTRNSHLHLITDGKRSHTINYLVLVLTLSSGMWKRESERDREEGNTYFITNNKEYMYITMIMKWNGIIEQSNTTINQKKVVVATTTSSTSHSSPPIRFYLIYISNNL